MGKLIDLTGLKFGRLTVINRAVTYNGRTQWECICDCGNKRSVNSYNLKHNLRRYRTVSCGCYQREIAGKTNLIHGRSKTREMQLFWEAIRRAKKSGIQFRIAPDDIKIPEICPLLGVKIIRDKPGSMSSPSIDRIITSKGYIPGNVWVVSYRANAIKNDATLDELKTLVKALEARCTI